MRNSIGACIIRASFIITRLMNVLCKRYYQELKIKLALLESEKKDFMKQTELCYQLCNSTWDEIRSIVGTYSFSSIESEIEFYKHIKPLFTSEIEYYRLVYHSLLFRPEATIALIPFWKRELQRLDRFIEECGSFYQYYKSGATELDQTYFTRLDEDEIDFSQVRVFDISYGIISSKDHFVSLILALEKYSGYVNQEVQKIDLN